MGVHRNHPRQAGIYGHPIPGLVFFSPLHTLSLSNLNHSSRFFILFIQMMPNISSLDFTFEHQTHKDKGLFHLDVSQELVTR